MQTAYFPGHVTDLPIGCTLCLAHEGVMGPGWVWTCSAARCYVQIPLLASPGMVVLLSLQLPGTARIRMEGLVTWARESEFGMEFLSGHSTMNQETFTV